MADRTTCLNELTWEDIKMIVNIHRDVLAVHSDRIMGSKENYEETLKVFLEYKRIKKRKE